MKLLSLIRALGTLLFGTPQSSARRFIRLVIVLSFVLSTSTWAVDPNKYVSQYAHTAWRIQGGFFKASPTAVAQTPDGYLWVGTRSGLLRFDGVRFVPWSPEHGDRLPSSEIRRLLAASDGSLWIGTLGGLSRWKNHTLTNYVSVRGGIGSILEDDKGNIWFTEILPASGSGPLCRILDGRPRCYGPGDGVPSFRGAAALLEDGQGNLWIGGDTTLLRWKADSNTVYIPDALRTNNATDGIVGLASARDGTLWVGISKPGSGLGLERLINGRWNSFKTPQLNGSDLYVAALYLDREDALWVGTYHGIYRIFGNEVKHFDTTNGLSSDSIWSFFEDREGNLWVATSQGMDRFSDTPVTSFSANEGLCTTNVDSVLASHDGSIWAGGSGALSNLRNGSVSCLRTGHGLPGAQVASLFEDSARRLWVGIDKTLSIYQNGRFREIKRPDGTSVGMVTGIDGDAENNIWIAVIGPPRTLMRIQGLQVREQYPEPQLPATRRVAADPTGGIWLGLLNGDLAHYQNGNLATYHFKNDDGALIYQLLANSDGSVLAATNYGLIGWKNGKLLSLTARQGLPCEAVNAMTFDNQGNLWLFMDCALGKIATTDLKKVWSNSGTRLSIETFDALDGVHPGAAAFVAAARTPDGRLWFANAELLQMIDPAHTKSNSAVPPVHVEQIIADRKNYSATSDVSLPPLIRSLEIDYTALSFAAPEKVRFRYKLEGHDADWQDPGTRRQAYYTDLAPRKYRFRVIAANNDGIWNKEGSILTFSIAPEWFQTLWFRLLCVAAFGFAALAIYQSRVRQIERQLSAGLEARLNERMRIARDLHDTLLQSLHGLMFQFQAARNLLPRRTDEAMQSLDDAINETEKALAESRDAIRDLRSEPIAQGDLAELLMTTSQNLAGSEHANDKSPIFNLIVEGERRTLSPMVKNEVYRISLEIMRNAFRHANARRIEAEIRYDAHTLRLRIRDDGRGIDSKVLKEGSPAGHWGLRGVRERAERIGAQLDFWSEVGAGTEVQLAVPAAVAYEKSQATFGSRLFRKARSHAQCS